MQSREPTRLTDAYVRSIPVPEPGEEAATVYDTVQRGFYVRVSHGGARTFGVKYSTAPGRWRRAKLGRLGELTTTQARVRAGKVRSEALDGVDAQEVRRDRTEAAEGATLADLLERYLRHRGESARPLSPKTIEEYRRGFRLYLAPALGTLPVRSISVEDAQRLHAQISGRSRRFGSPKGGTTTANRILALLSVLLTHAELVGARERGTNPCRLVSRNVERPRERRLTLGDARRLWATLSESEADGSERLIDTTLIRLLLLTGCRRDELRTLRWSDVELTADGGRITLSRTKTSERTGARTIPFGSSVRRLLGSLPRNSEFVFPGVRLRSRPIAKPSYTLNRLCERADIERIALHDLRRSFVSLLTDNGTAPHVAEAAGGWVPQGVMGRHYQHVEPRLVIECHEKLTALLRENVDCEA